MDGRERMVDWYERFLTEMTDRRDMSPRMAPYWGDDTAHDNNRDGLQQSQPLTRHYTDTIDPITVSEVGDQQSQRRRPFLRDVRQQPPGNDRARPAQRPRCLSMAMRTRSERDEHGRSVAHVAHVSPVAGRDLARVLLARTAHTHATRAVPLDAC